MVATNRIVAHSPDAATKSGPTELSRYAARGGVGGPARCRLSGRARTRGRCAPSAGPIDHVDRLRDVVVAFPPRAADRHLSTLTAGADRPDRDDRPAPGDDFGTAEP